MRRDSPTGQIIHTFTNTTGMDIIDCGSIANFLFVDQVPAESKPTSDGTHDGIKVQGGTGGHLMIDAGPHDNSIKITQSTSTSATIQSSNGIDTGNSRFGSGVNKLTIETDPNGNAIVSVGTREPFPLPDLPGLSPDTSLRVNTRGDGDSVVFGGAENVSVDAIIHVGASNNSILLQQFEGFTPPHSDGTISATIDFDPTVGGGLNANNRLEIGTNGNGLQCSATLARAPDTSAHEIEVGTVIVTNGLGSGPEPAGLIVAESTTIGEVRLDEDTEMSVEAPLTLENNSFNTSGTFFADGTVEFTGTSAPSTIHEFDFDNLSFAVAEGVVNLLAGADVNVLTSSNIKTLNIGEDAKLTLQQRAGAPSQSNARVLKVGSLHIDKTSANPLGQLDLKDNAMIVDYDGSSPVDDIRLLITGGYNGGAWTGDGINSSIAATRSDVGLGYGEATDIFTFPLPNPPPTFEGQVPDETMVLVKYTFYGDATLDGMVNLADFNRVAGNFGGQPRRWTQGDFNYDTVVNLADFNRLAANFGRFGLGSGNPADIEDISQEELMDMWEDATGGG